MKDAPAIAPEVVDLMEEIVADPRSAMRLVPRKALRSWFDTGEAARASEIASTRAERHLIEEHRESLAALLCEAAWIAYWKAPVLAHRPVGEDGRPYDPIRCEPRWQARVKRHAQGDHEDANGFALLQRSLESLDAANANALAVASLRLVPTDRTRCYVALTIPWDRPRSAMRFFKRLSENAWPTSLRPKALESLGARQCSLGLYREACDSYQAAALATPESPYALACVVALSCVMGEPQTLLLEARRLGEVTSAADERMMEEVRLLQAWASTLPANARAVARNTRDLVSSGLSDVGRQITEVFVT